MALYQASDMKPVDVTRGTSPIVLAVPHAGIYVPDEIKQHFNATGQALADTDWHVDKLYDGLLEGATVVRATFHRYVIDANRDPSGQSLYPGQNTTGLCPIIDFFGTPIYEDGADPDDREIERRRVLFHAPYHTTLQAEIERVREACGVAVLYDCHSIRSQIPFLFDGSLPDFNIGTNGGETCAPQIEKRVFDICQSAKDYTSVLNGRFKGGWTTRHYGNPENNVHAIQMELAQTTYMHEASPWTYDDDKASRLRVQLKNILGALSETAPTLSI